MKDQDTPMSENDDDIARLMELAGPRAEPPAAARERVYQAVLQRWEQTPFIKPQASHQRRWMALAASVLLGLGIGYLTLNQLPADAPGVSGNIVFASGGYSIRGSQDISAPQLQEGAMLRTSGKGRLLIQLDEYTTLRLDHNTSITLQSSAEIWLHSGRLYADSINGAGIRIETPFATITDVGTQFEVTANGETLKVTVREGGVEVKLLGNQVLTATAQAGMGERLTILGANEVQRDTLATTDPSWSWTQGARDAYDLEANSLHDFLFWATRESGLRLRFTSDAVRIASDSTKPCCGKVLDPRQAIDDVLATSDFLALDGQAYELLIDFRR